MTTRHSKLVLLAPALALALGAAPRRAEACGAMVFPAHAERPGGMEGQEIFLSLGPDATTLVVSASFIDAEGDKAFLLPVRAVPDEVLDANEALFIALETGTVPIVAIRDGTEKPEPIACGAKSGDGSNEFGGSNDVEVLDRGSTATYDYVVVGGDTGTALADWLDSNGFGLPADFAGALDDYASNGWYFLAARLSSTAPEGALAPLELRFPAAPGSATTIPFGIAAYALAPDDSIDLTLYVASTEAAVVPQNYALGIIDEDAIEATSAETSNYAALFDALVTAEPTWVVESSRGAWNPSTLDNLVEGDWEYGVNLDMIDQDGADWLSDFHQRLGYDQARLTRLRTRLNATALVDLQLGPGAAVDVLHVHDVVWDPDGGGGCSTNHSGGGALLGFGLLGLAGLLRRQRARR